MLTFAERFTKLLEIKQTTSYKVALEVGLDPTLVGNIAKGKRKPTNRVLEHLSESKVLGVPFIELKAWELLDQYPPDVLREAIRIELEKRKKP